MRPTINVVAVASEQSVVARSADERIDLCPGVHQRRRVRASNIWKTEAGSLVSAVQDVGAVPAVERIGA